MSNLTTRKIVLGLLMTLVLAFGVLGNADAIDSLDPELRGPSDGNRWQRLSDTIYGRTPVSEERFSLYEFQGTNQSLSQCSCH